MGSNADLLQAYILNVVVNTFMDRSKAPLMEKIARAAIVSIPQRVTIDTTPLISRVANNNYFAQNPPSAQYQDGYEMVRRWSTQMDNVKAIPASDNVLTKATEVVIKN